MKQSRYAWVVVGLLWMIWLLNYLDRQVIFSVFPLLQADLKLDAVQLGLISTAFLWVYAAASPFAGYAADRFGRKPIIVFSLLVWSVVTWVTGHVHSLSALLTARAVMGISEACYLPAGLALIAGWHGERTRSTATGIHYSGGYLGMILGGGLGGWMGEHYGWRAAFVVLGVIGVAYSIVAILAIKDTRSEAGEKRAHGSVIAAVRALFALPGYKTMFTVFALVSVGNWAVYTWLPLYLYERFSLDLAHAGFSATFYLQAGSAAGIVLGGLAADAWSGRTHRARILTQAIGLAAAAPFLFASGWTSSVAVLIVGMVVFGLGRGTYDANCMPALCQIAPEQLRATGFGVFNFIGPFAGGIAASAAGALKSTIGIGGALEAAGILLGVSALLLLAMVRGANWAQLPEPARSFHGDYSQ